VAGKAVPVEMDADTALLFALAIDDWDVFKGDFDIERFFPNEEVCRQYLIRKRWPHGYQCPRCFHPAGYFIGERQLMECARPSCRYQVSITAGTMLHRTRLPIRTWFMAIQIITKLDWVTVAYLAKQLKVTYKTASLLMVKIDKAIQYFGKEAASEFRHPLEVIFTHPEDEEGEDFPKEAVMALECTDGDAPAGDLPSEEAARKAFLAAGLFIHKKIPRAEWERRHQLKRLWFSLRIITFLPGLISCVHAPPLYSILRRRQERLLCGAA